MNIEHRYASVSEAAKILGVPTKSILTLLKRGQLPGIRVGTKWKINRELLSTWIPEPNSLPNPYYDRQNARWSIEQLLIRQPQVNIAGVYYKNQIHYIVCPGYETIQANDGTPLEEWVRQHSSRCAPVNLVHKAPEGAVEWQPRSAEEIGALTGYPLNRGAHEHLLTLKLSRDFPLHDYHLEPGPPQEVVAIVSRDLSNPEVESLERIWKELGTSLPIRVRVSTQDGERPHLESDDSDRLALPLANSIGNSTPKILREAYENDEDFWRTASPLMWTEEAKRLRPLPKAFEDGRGKSCLVSSSVFPMANIRIYLAQHEQVILELPLESSEEHFFESASITRTELIYLVSIGRVHIAAPYSPKRYSTKLFTDVLECSRERVLMPRRLATAAALESRRRHFFCYPILNISDRNKVLKRIRLLSNSANPSDKVILEELANALQGHWPTGAYHLNFRGPLASRSSAMSELAAGLASRQFEKNLFVEATAAMSLVEWGAALGATVIPRQTDGYCETAMMRFCANLYSGTAIGLAEANTTESELIIGSLLGPLSDADIRDFCRVFDGNITRRVHSLLEGILSNSVTPEELSSEIELYNSKVQRFEKRRNYLKWIDFTSLIGRIAALSFSPYFLLGEWVLKRLLTTEGLPSSSRLRYLGEHIESIATRTPIDIVMVANLRSEFTKIRKMLPATGG